MNREQGEVNSLPSAPDALAKFREKYSPRDPLLPSTANESLLLDGTTGFRLLESAPARNVEFGHPPPTRQGGGTHRYLWVINDDGIPFIKEIGLSVLNGKYPKHTNLTGGRPAYIGGELWFETTEQLFVSGGSGRYLPYDEEHLAEAVDVFRTYGYTVTSLGWDVDSQRPYRHLEQSHE